MKMSQSLLSSVVPSKITWENQETQKARVLALTYYYLFIFQRANKRDISTYENIRGPRPWENSKEMQAEQRKQLALKNSLIGEMMAKAEKEKKS